MMPDAAGSPSTARDRAEAAVTSAVLREVAGFRRSIELDALTALMETLPIVIENAMAQPEVLRALAGEAEPSPERCPDCERDRADGRWNLCPLHEIEGVPTGGSAPHQGAPTDSLRSRLVGALGLMPGLSDDELVSGASFVREAADGFATRLAATERERDQGATTDVTALSAVLAQAEHDASCRCGYTPQAPSDRHRVMAEAAVRALLGAGETTEADK